MLGEGRAGEGLCGDVCEVISGRIFDEEDAASLFRVTNHGVARGDPLGFIRDAAAARAVDEDSGIGEDLRGVGRGMKEFTEKGSDAEDCLNTTNGLEELSGSGSVTSVRG